MRAKAAGILIVTALALVGCGDDDTTGTTGAETTSAETASPETAPGDGGGAVRLQKLGDFDQPLYVTQPPGSEDLYVVEKPGRVQLLRGGRGEPAPALDIADEVSDESEQGLLSIAFAPDAETSRLLYAYFTDSS
ncbi:MAG: PQQ-dependent sugar dehydrogenase, partial [Actinomycetota bacterium]|nr:PQQ-dependent sugar dehydrogenase [Actinomycetota bacterium]